jgi:ParB family chromosome partitioning protein
LKGSRSRDFSEEEEMKRKYQEVCLARIRANKWNPRKNFSGPKFDDLVASIKSKGVIEPILLRTLKKDNYEIVAGERRFRASCKIAEKNGGLKKCTIPAIIQELNDDEAFEILTIENLQREDLTELEEARSFQSYIVHKGDGSLTDLAEKTGINPRYIRRRIAILMLPDKILAAWEKGKIAFGHCEQLCRMSSKEKVLEYLKQVLDYDWPVHELRRRIDEESIGLGHALFDTEAYGCGSCARNSDVQKELFGDESAMERTSCLDPACFKKFQNEHLLSNWAKKYRKKYGTNGFRFFEGWGSRDNHYPFANNYGPDKKPGDKCLECKSFVTILELSGNAHCKQACVGDVKCYQAIRAKPLKTLKCTGPGDGIQQTDEPRVSWHGQHFREEFYQATLPGVFSQVPNDDDRALRFALAAILNSNSEALQNFRIKYQGKNPERLTYYEPFEETWEVIEKMTGFMLRDAIQGMALLIALQGDKTDHKVRALMATHLGIDLARDWRITPEYLEKKTRAELLALGEKLGIFADPKAEAFLKETLKKKKFTALKKGELVRMFMESGVDLAGKVPDEILRMEPRREFEEEEENMEPRCRVCGCTEDSPCEGGCFWVEDDEAGDLCSACQRRGS